MAPTKWHRQRRVTIDEPRINERIRVPDVRLVGPNGEQVGIVRVEDALRLAEEAGLDLVEVAPTAKPPVAKLMDFGKFKYEQAMKAREARKNQVNTVIKEIKLRPKIDPHDYGTKLGHIERFLKAGDKVKVTIWLRGREQSRPELGFRLLGRVAEDTAEFGFVESSPKQDGRNMIMVLGPTRKKSDAKAEQRRRQGGPREPGAAPRPAPGRPTEGERAGSVAESAETAEALAQLDDLETENLLDADDLDVDDLDTDDDTDDDTADLLDDATAEAPEQPDQPARPAPVESAPAVEPAPEPAPVEPKPATPPPAAPVRPPAARPAPARPKPSTPATAVPAPRPGPRPAAPPPRAPRRPSAPSDPTT